MKQTSRKPKVHFYRERNFPQYCLKNCYKYYRYSTQNFERLIKSLNKCKRNKKQYVKKITYRTLQVIKYIGRRLWIRSLVVKSVQFKIQRSLVRGLWRWKLIITANSNRLLCRCFARKSNTLIDKKISLNFKKCYYVLMLKTFLKWYSSALKI